MTITAAVDGSALGNPGPAGWAWYIDDEQWAAGGWPNSTNNRGELQAVLELLRATAAEGQESSGADEALHILCDSKYVINAVTKWMPVWKLKGWKKANGKDVLNRDIIEDLDAELEGRKVTFEWVKGHSNHRMNEAADSRARGAAEAYRRNAPVPTGPGLAGRTKAAGEAAAAESAAAGAAAAEATRETDEDAPESDERAPVTVGCPVPAVVADQIVVRARAAGRSPQQELAELIELGMERKYGA